MPELPEVEVLARYLLPVIRGKTIHSVDVRRAKILKPTSPQDFQRALAGAKFTGLSRRGKYLLFALRAKASGKEFTLLGHLGMTGKMFVARKKEPLPKHAAVVFDLGRENFIYEDTRYFGRMTLDISAVAKLGPEPLSNDFQPATFAQALKRSRQTPLDRDLQARKRSAEQEQSAKTRAEEERAAQQRAENCRSARGHVSALETGQRIVRVNDKGEQEILDDRGRAEDLRRAREVISSECR